jgi:hypothetical protein
VSAVTNNIIYVDILSNGESWFGSNRIASKSAYPELNAAKSLRGLGINLDTPVAIRKMGVVVRHSTVEFILRHERAETALTQ